MSTYELVIKGEGILACGYKLNETKGDFWCQAPQEFLVDHIFFGEETIKGNAIPSELIIDGSMGEEEIPLGVDLSHDVVLDGVVPQEVYGPYSRSIESVELWHIDGESREMVARSNSFDANAMASVTNMAVDDEDYEPVTAFFNVEPYNLLTVEEEVGCWSYIFDDIENTPSLSDFTVVETNCVFGPGADEFIDDVVFMILLGTKISSLGARTETDNVGKLAFAIAG